MAGFGSVDDPDIQKMFADIPAFALADMSGMGRREFAEIVESLNG